MFRSGYFLLLIILLAGLYSCGVRKPAVQPVITNDVAGNYIRQYKDLAVSEMKRTGIPASITLAQGMIESDYGRSRLAVQANNHFGIKCHSTWKGPVIRHHDDRRNECFRKYRKAEDSYYDHSDFLTSASRYSFLFDLAATDYKGWARGLKKAGYATNPDYAGMLIRKIEEYELWRYDKPEKNGIKKDNRNDTSVIVKLPETEERMTANPIQPARDNFTVPSKVSRIKENNRIQYIIVEEGDTRESIENEFSMLKWELSRYNEREIGSLLVPGQILYLQPKRDKADYGNDIHVVAAGDSMYLISQKYGVKVRKLYEYNRMNEADEPREGDKIWLRGMKPVN